MTESKSKQIAARSQDLALRRERISQQRQALRENALQYCRKPSTLGAAALSGFLLARLLPPLVGSRRGQRARPPSRLLDPLIQMIPVLVFERVRHALIRRAQTPLHRQKAEGNPGTSASQ